VVEHADFFVNPQRVVQRQHVDEWAEPQGPRALDRGGEKDTGAGGQPERRRVVLRQMIAGKTAAFDGFNKPQPFFEERAQRCAVAVEMIENRKFKHGRAFP